MPATLKTIRKRDNLERELTSFQSSITSSETRKQYFEQLYKQKFDFYQKWKEDNKIEGIKF